MTLPTAHERALQRAYQEMTPTQSPINPEKRQTSAPPPKPPSEVSSRPKVRPADADLPDRFIAALGELIREMKTSRAGQKRYELKKGRRIETAGDDISYRFLFADRVDWEPTISGSSTPVKSSNSVLR